MIRNRCVGWLACSMAIGVIGLLIDWFGGWLFYVSRARYAPCCVELWPRAADQISTTPLGRGRARHVIDKNANRAVRVSIPVACVFVARVFVRLALVIKRAFLSSL